MMSESFQTLSLSNMEILSPITNSPNIRLVDKFISNKIIELYKDDLDIDVSNTFENTEHVLIYECLSTGYLFYYPFHIMGDEKLYDELKIKMPEIYHIPYYPEWKWEYDIALQCIKKSETVLEVGCGSGRFLSRLKEDNKDRKLKGLELNQFSVDKAISNGLDVELETIQNFSNRKGEQYDVVCIFQVLEHVCEVRSFLEASIGSLKQNGKLIIAVPLNNPYLFKNDIFNTLNLPPHHMGLWNKEAFGNLTKFFPLKLEKLIIERLPNAGCDFERYYVINKDIIYKPSFPFKRLFDKLYLKYLKRNHENYTGKNIIVSYSKI